MNTKTQHIVINGHFSKNGNFIGTDNDEKEIHIYKAQMENKHITMDNLKFPLFVIATVKTFDKLTGEFGDTERKNVLKSDGQNETFERLTALAVFKNFEDFINAYTEHAELNLNFNNDEVKESLSEIEAAFKKYFEYKTHKLRAGYEA